MLLTINAVLATNRPGRAQSESHNGRQLRCSAKTSHTCYILAGSGGEGDGM